MALISILPALIAAVVGVAILLLGRALRAWQFDGALCWLGLLAAAATLALANPAPEPAGRPLVSAVTRDSLARGTAWMALLAGATCAALTAIGPKPRRTGRHAVLLLSIGGLLLACAANDFVLVIIGVPVSALAVCAGQFWEAETVQERIAAVQSLSLNVLGALCLVCGALLVSGVAGTTNFSELHALPAHASDHLARGPRALPLAGEVGTVLLLAGLGIPLLAAPFQLAAAEIFERATAWCMGLMAVLPRCAVVVAMIRIFVGGIPGYLLTAQTALTAAALVTILIGGSLAYWQTSLRRLIALVLMVQAGLILIALAAACSEASRPGAVPWLDLQTPGGMGAAWLLFGVDSFALLGLAAILSALERPEGRVDDLEEFSRLVSGDRLTAAAACLLLLSLAGIPPLPGFWARVALLRSVLSVSFPSDNGFLPHQNTGYVLFALLTVAGSIAVAAPCLSVATHLLFPNTPIETGDSHVSLAPGRLNRGGLRFSAAVAAVLLALGFFPNLGLHLAARVASPKPAASALAAEKLAHPVKKHRRPSNEDSE